MASRIELLPAEDTTSDQNSFDGRSLSIGIVIVLFLIFFVIVILFFVLNPPGEEDNPDEAQQEVGFNETCGQQIKCGTGLTCDNNVCKKNEGLVCEADSDCAGSNNCLGLVLDDQGTVTSLGVCSSTLEVSGGLNQPSPCHPGLEPDEHGVCKLSVLSSGCSNDGVDINSNCITGVCESNVCQEAKAVGQSCLPGQCAGGLSCSQGFCQENGLITGQVGAYCLPDDTPGCNPGLSCGWDNTCQPGSATLLDECDEVDAFCRRPYVCAVAGDSATTVCQYPEPANSCQGTSACSRGYRCRSTGDGQSQCLGRSNTVCAENNQCINGECRKEERALFVSPITAENNEGWSYLTALPRGVRFQRFVVLDQTGQIWGLERSKGAEIAGTGGLYYLRNAQSSSWSRVQPATHKLVRYEEHGDQVITIEELTTIVTIATNGQYLYGVVKRSFIVPCDPSADRTNWSIDRIELLPSGRINFFSGDNLQPPMTTEEEELVNIVDLDLNSDNDIVLVANTELELGDSRNFIYSKATAETTFTLVETGRDIDKHERTRFYRLDGEVDNSLNIAYISGDDDQDQRLFFTGTLAALVYPNNNQSYQIPDLAVSKSSLGTVDDSDTGITFSNGLSVWFNVIGVTESDDTAYWFLSGISDSGTNDQLTAFLYPGYNDQTSRLYVGANEVYTMSAGTCA